MNREIKFRGKDLNTNEWVFGSLLKIGGNYHILSETDMYDDGHHVCQKSDIPTWVEQKTIGQFTGLKDKNGKDIFEGDIVEVTCLEISQYGRKMLCLVVYDEELACFSFKASDRIRCMSATIPDADIEVVGNRFDNPELLNE